jgi:hypothetical protein
LVSLRAEPDSIDDERSATAPHSFEIMLIEIDAKRFAGRRTFIEMAEKSSTDFYDLVGQHLRPWQAPPPKPVRITDALLPESDSSGVDSLDGSESEKV